MHGRFKFEKLVKYPHMKPADVSVWEKFIDQHPGFFDRVDYDFHVGTGADFLPDKEDTPDGRENRLYKKKIDVVGYKENEIYIIEVKPKATMEALGQALALTELFDRPENFSGNLTAAMIAGKMSNDMNNVFNSFNVMVFIV